ncbi:MAG: hypothetical protein R2867_31675 [Caldilineaceae bacterium]
MIIEILPYATRWPEEFRQIGGRLRSILGETRYVSITLALHRCPT